MEDSKTSIRNRIFNLLDKIVSPSWKQSRIQAYKQVQSMKKRQDSLSIEEAHREARIQAEKIRKQRAEKRF